MSNQNWHLGWVMEKNCEETAIGFGGGRCVSLFCCSVHPFMDAGAEQGSLLHDLSVGWAILPIAPRPRLSYTG
jgi:hypothetical protein